MSPLLTFNPIALKYDYAYRAGIYEGLKWATRYGVPLLITETGVEDAADTGLASQWIVADVQWVKRAIHDGVTVEGTSTGR